MSKKKYDPFPNGLLYEERPGEETGEIIITIWEKDDVQRRHDVVVAFSIYDDEGVLCTIDYYIKRFHNDERAKAALRWFKEYKEND